jgi:Cadherin domain
VLASSSDGSTSSQSFSITVDDVSDHAVGAVTDTDPTAARVAENAATGTAVGITALAIDLDATNNSVTYSLSDDAGGRFAIDANLGVVTVADGSLLNYEGLSSHDITIVATGSDGSSSSLTTSIALSDVDEFDTSVPTDDDATANSVAESPANGTTVGITALATDLDGTNHTISYSLSDDAGGRFAIDATSGIVSVADGTLLDAESATAHNITVLATSSDGSSSSQSFLIGITDANDHDISTIADADAAAQSVTENTTSGTAVGITARAFDADITNNDITYSLSDDAGGRFTIDATSGVISIADASLIDFESSATHDITIVATSSDGSSTALSTTIQLLDINDNAPRFLQPDPSGTGTLTVDEGRLFATTVLARDADAVSTITYLISGGADADLFMINPDGTLSFKAAQDYLNPQDANRDRVYELIITATDGTLSQTLPLQIVLNQVAVPNLPAPITPVPDQGVADSTPSEDTALLTPEGQVTPDSAASEQPGVPRPAQRSDPAEASANANAPDALRITGATAATASNVRRAAGNVSSFDASAIWVHAVDPIFIQLTDIQTHLKVNDTQVLSPTAGITIGASPRWVAPEQDTQSQAVALKTTISKVGGVSLSLGAVWWAARAGGLMSSLLLTTPAWRVLDPLPVFMGKQDDEDDTGTDEEAAAERLFEARRAIRGADELIH